MTAPNGFHQRHNVGSLDLDDFVIAALTLASISFTGSLSNPSSPMAKLELNFISRCWVIGLSDFGTVDEMKNH
jgi:hypothetical protein